MFVAFIHQLFSVFLLYVSDVVLLSVCVYIPKHIIAGEPPVLFISSLYTTFIRHAVSQDNVQNVCCNMPAHFSTIFLFLPFFI